MSFVEPADEPPKRRVPPRHQRGSYSIDPITRRRLYGTSDGSGQQPATTQQDDYRFFGPNKIQNLTSANFDEVIQGMEKVIVMFYSPRSGSNACAGLEFVKAADMPHPDNHAYAAVNCTQESELCEREGATTQPIFKLYSNGFSFVTIRDTKQFCAGKMQRMMKMTPVRTEPRGKVAPGVKRR